MHPFYDYLCEHLDELLKKRCVVVFYDPRSEFEPFFDRELETQKGGELPRVMIGDRAAFLARYNGTFFGLRAVVEPVVAADKPEPLLLYLPGITRDRAGSVLMELEKGGACYEPQLKRLALNVLRKRFTDGQIDEMLRPASVETDNPGGNTLDLHRRGWIGHGGTTPAGAVRVTGAELGYDTDLDFVFPTGLGVFKAGGGLNFHHGGFSLQEPAIPVISLRMASGKPAEAPGVNVRIEGCPANVTNRTFGVKLAAAGDLLATEPLVLRVLLMSGAEEVGRPGRHGGWGGVRPEEGHPNPGPGRRSQHRRDAEQRRLQVAPRRRAGCPYRRGAGRVRRAAG